jgi:hypothetical protein
MRPARLFGTAVLALSLNAIVSAQFVQPLSYSALVGAHPVYPDSGDVELTDGVTGLDFSAYSNASEAYDWSGWRYSGPATVTFQFGSAMSFSRIEVGVDRHSGAGNELVDSITVSGNTFNFAASTIPDNTRDWLVLDGTLATDGSGALNLDFGSNYGEWFFMDEIRFTAIPEPAGTTAIIGAVLAGAIAVVRRRSTRSSPVRIR